MHACIPQVFLGTECSPEIFPRPLPRVSWVTILVPGSSGGGVGVSHPWVAGPRPGWGGLRAGPGACKVTVFGPGARHLVPASGAQRTAAWPLPVVWHRCLGTPWPVSHAAPTAYGDKEGPKVRFQTLHRCSTGAQGGAAPVFSSRNERLPQRSRG